MRELACATPGYLRIQPHKQMGIQIKCTCCGEVHVPKVHFKYFRDSKEWLHKIITKHRKCKRA